MPQGTYGSLIRFDLSHIGLFGYERVAMHAIAPYTGWKDGYVEDRVNLEVLMSPDHPTYLQEGLISPIWWLLGSF